MMHQTTLPEKFIIRAKQIIGKEYDAFIVSLSEVAPVSIRINPFKRSEVFSSAEKIPWSVEGRYLEQRPSFTLDPLFHAGCYYVQDASSQFLEKVFLQVRNLFNRPLRILDLCAAPGGKSTHLLSLMNDEDLLVCNEVVASRNAVLRQNIIKWGRPNVIVTQNDPSDFNRLENYFDIIVVDAPCSGEGLFRKDPEAISEWSEENVNRCSLRQQEILDHAYASLKPGGCIIYSTCTFEEEENDQQAEMLCEKFDIQKLKIENNFQGIEKTKTGLAFFPHRIRGEGFYISLLQKNGETNVQSSKQADNVDSANKKYLERFIDNANEFSAVLKDDRLFAIPNLHFSDFKYLSRNLYVRLAGIFVGEFKGEDLIPSPALALSCRLRTDFPCIDLNEEQALQYLRGGDIKVDVAKGWCLITFKNFSLGWIKNLGSRVNNYYPKEWRIRK